jgi:hypothetical protein
MFLQKKKISVMFSPIYLTLEKMSIMFSMGFD